MTSSNGNIFRITGPLCVEFTSPGEFPTKRPVTRSFDVFFDLRLNKRLSKQPGDWWFETSSWSLWRHCNDKHKKVCIYSDIGLGIGDRIANRMVIFNKNNETVNNVHHPLNVLYSYTSLIVNPSFREKIGMMNIYADWNVQAFHCLA